MRRRASSLTVVVPATPEFAAVGQTPIGKTVAAIMTHDHRRELSAARSLLARHGARVVVATPGDTPARLLARRRRAA